MKKKSAIEDLLKVMAKLRSPKGCPWDREQTHLTLRRHAIEEVYELIDAIESRDDHEIAEELGDLLLQVVFHAQMAKERGAFDFEKVTRQLVDKLIRRHPHVFGTTKVKNVDEVWTNWEKIKRAEKHGTHLERKSALDGIPKHLPALLRAEKLLKKAKKADLFPAEKSSKRKFSKTNLAKELFELASFAQLRGWCAEELLAGEIKKRERLFRRREKM
ncbi:MAG TPA: MazG family protein [Verrucomicrobiae bacterium]|jgi:MazG family protein|nr:MazG family protein [Verrucomicrobiae bacterium]